MTCLQPLPTDSASVTSDSRDQSCKVPFASSGREMRMSLSGGLSRPTPLAIFHFGCIGSAPATWLESRVKLIAGAVPIQRIELSRYPRAYGDWFPNCRMAGCYLWGVGPLFGGGMRLRLLRSIEGWTVRAIFTYANEPPKHTSAVPASESLMLVRDVADKNHQVMRSLMPGLLGMALLLPLVDAPSRSREDSLFCRPGRVVGAAPLR
jgi:hypothetical protein